MNKPIEDWEKEILKEIDMGTRKIGEKINIICPECDGSGIGEPEIIANAKTTNAATKCPVCKGEGKVEGTVSR